MFRQRTLLYIKNWILSQSIITLITNIRLKRTLQISPRTSEGRRTSGKYRHGPLLTSRSLAHSIIVIPSELNLRDSLTEQSASFLCSGQGFCGLHLLAFQSFSLTQPCRLLLVELPLSHLFLVRYLLVGRLCLVQSSDQEFLLMVQRLFDLLKLGFSILLSEYNFLHQPLFRQICFSKFSFQAI